MEQVNVFRLEIEDFALAIMEGRPPALGLQEGLLNARILDWLAQEARSEEKG